MEPARGEEPVIGQLAFESDEQFFTSSLEEPLDDGDIAFGQGLTLLAVAVAALALGLLPAAVGVVIVLGWTVPLEFGAGAGLAIVAVIKLGAGAWGVASSIRAPRSAAPDAGIHL